MSSAAAPGVGTGLALVERGTGAGPVVGVVWANDPVGGPKISTTVKACLHQIGPPTTQKHVVPSRRAHHSGFTVLSHRIILPS